MNKPTDQDPLLMDHNYDGIEELDNPMPTWWLVTFFATIIFAGIYYFHYEVTQSSTSDLELAQDMAKIEALRKASKATSADAPEVDLNSLIGDPKAIASGDKAYQAKCAACHGSKGEGLIGPNLADDYWIHGAGDIKSVVHIINVGVPDKGMPAWAEMVSVQEANNIAAYVVSLRGTNPPNAKKPEGNKAE